MPHRLLFIIILSGALFIASCKPNSKVPPEGVETAAVVDSTSQQAAISYDAFGFPYDSLSVQDYKVKRNESLYTILDKFDFTPRQIYFATNHAKKIFDVRSFKPGQDYRVYASADSANPISRLVWQPNPVDFVVFDWQDSLSIYKQEKLVITKTTTAGIEIEHSLYEAISKEKLSPLLAYKLSEIYAWEIDFFNLRKNDRVKMVYQKKYVDDSFYSIGDILAVKFTHMGRTYSAYKFENEGIEGYFDEDGNSVQKALLKTPFKYNQRISSGFSRSRFHPVLKRRMPHYGIDYAAPYGTPVLSVGDGTVIEARYRGANGNIVKIRHNGTYQTAYLHLKGFARGIRNGARVKQGQVIGYVGHTGRVTGTHLDYRIYKNGHPVNPLKIDLPASDSVPKTATDSFERQREKYDLELEAVSKPEIILTQK